MLNFTYYHIYLLFIYLLSESGSRKKCFTRNSLRMEFLHTYNWQPELHPTNVLSPKTIIIVDLEVTTGQTEQRYSEPDINTKSDKYQIKHTQHPAGTTLEKWSAMYQERIVTHKSRFSICDLPISESKLWRTELLLFMLLISWSFFSSLQRQWTHALDIFGKQTMENTENKATATRTILSASSCTKFK